MDSIFPALGSSLFKTAPLVDYFNTEGKAKTPTPTPPAVAYPAPAEKSDSRQDKVALPGRGRLIDYSV